MSVLGSIEIQMLADLARLKSDMDQAKRVVGDATDRINSVLGTIGVGLSVAAFATFVKSAIDAGDAAYTMASKVGLSVEELTALQAAFKQSGIEIDGLQTGLVKLAKSATDNEGAFKAIGVNVRNAAGEMKGSGELLREVADFFAVLPDGVTKTALAVELFGKSGADMIPVLNGGSKAINDMADEAKRLGAVMSTEATAAADEFNDSLDMLLLRAKAATLEGIAPMLPLLSEIVRQFGAVGTATKDSADSAGFFSDAFRIAIEAVSVLALNTVYVFRAMGGEISAIASQAQALAKLDFDAFTKIGDEWKAKAQAMREEVDRQTIAIVTFNERSKQAAEAIKGAGDQSSYAAAEMRRFGVATNSTATAQAEAALKAKELEAEQKKATEALKKHNEELDKAGAALLLVQGGYSADLLDKLGQYNELLKTGRINQEQYNKAVQDLIEKQPFMAKITETLKDQASVDLRWIKQYTDAQTKIDDAVDAAGKMVKAIEDETAALGMSNTEREISNALLALEKSGIEKGTYAYEVYSEKIKGAILDREAVKESIKQADDISKEWAKQADQMGQSLTDALFRAFEKGGDFFGSMWEMIKNTIKTTVLKPIIQGVTAPVTAAVGSAFGMAGTANAANGAASSAFDVASLLGPAGNWLTNFGGQVGNLYSGFAESGLGKLLGMGGAGVDPITGLATSTNAAAGSVAEFAAAAGDAVGYLNAVYALSQGKYGQAAGAAIGTYFGGPIGSFIGSQIGSFVDKLAAGGAGTPHMGADYISDGVTGYNPADLVAGSMAYGDSVNKNRSTEVEKALAGVTGISASLLNRLDKAFGGAGGYQVAGYFASDGQDKSQGNVSVLRDGAQLSTFGSQGYDKDAKTGFAQYSQDLAAQVRGALDSVDLPDWATDRISQISDSASLEQLTQAVAAIAQMRESLTALNAALTPLGSTFGSFTSASEEARLAVVGLTGGFEAFAAKAAGFVKNFYSQDEQTGLAARQITEALRAGGFNDAQIGLLDSKADFRALLERVDVSTSVGQEQFAALLNTQQAFADLSASLEEGITGLLDLVSLAPEVDALAAAQTEAQAETAATQAQTLTDISTGITTVADLTAEVRDAVREVVDAVASLTESTTAENTAIATAAAKTASILDRVTQNGNSLKTVAA